jgi:hypothetical protein
MRYAKVIDGAVVTYPYTISMLKADNPQVSFPRDPSSIRIEDWNVVAVEAVARPAPSSLSVNVVEDTPALVDGVWRQAWKEVAASADEIAQRTQEAADADVLASTKADAFVQQFIAMTPAEVVAYVEANVTNIASTKTLLKRITVMMLLMMRREYR